MEPVKKQARRQSFGSKDRHAAVEGEAAKKEPSAAATSGKEEEVGTTVDEGEKAVLAPDEAAPDAASSKETSAEATPEKNNNAVAAVQEEEKASPVPNGAGPAAQEQEEKMEVEGEGSVKKEAHANGADANTSLDKDTSDNHEEKAATVFANGGVMEEKGMDVEEVVVKKENGDEVATSNGEAKKEEKPKENAKPHKKGDVKLQKVGVKLPPPVKRLALLDMYSGCGALTTGLEMGGTPRGVTIETVSSP